MDTDKIFAEYKENRPTLYYNLVEPPPVPTAPTIDEDFALSKLNKITQYLQNQHNLQNSQQESPLQIQYVLQPQYIQQGYTGVPQQIDESYQLIPLQMDLNVLITSTNDKQGEQKAIVSSKGRKEYPEINPNCRDFGGLGNIAYGKMYRGGLYGGNLKKIKDLGITHEITVTGNKKHLPLPSSNIYGGDWRHLSDKQKGLVISKCMQWIIEGHKVYIHCDRGCDRTGHISAILEGILGVSREDMINDFKLSDTKGKGYKIAHPDSTIAGYCNRYGGKGTSGAAYQLNFINNVSKKYGVDVNLMKQFIAAATNQIQTKKSGGILKFLSGGLTDYVDTDKLFAEYKKHSHTPFTTITISAPAIPEAPKLKTPEIATTTSSTSDNDYSKVFASAKSSNSGSTGSRVQYVLQIPTYLVVTPNYQMMNAGMTMGNNQQIVTNGGTTTQSGNSGITDTSETIKLSGNKKEFFSKMMGPILKALQNNGVSLEWTKACLAQLALESGFGKHQSGKNNFAGMKATKSEPGTMCNTHEVIKGKRIAQRSKFKDYNTVQDFCNEYVYRIKNKFRGFDGQLNDFIPNIKSHKYFTAPLQSYYNSWKKIVNSI